MPTYNMEKSCPATFTSHEMNIWGEYSLGSIGLGITAEVKAVMLRNKFDKSKEES